jgi:YD repeat-containing protein
VTNAIANSVTNTYDTRNRLTKATDNFGVETKTEYNDNSTIEKTIDAEGHYTNYAYDGNNQRTTTKDERGLIQTVEYNEVGLVETVKLPSSMPSVG